MNRIHEVYQRDILMAPQSIGNGGNATGNYHAVNAVHDVQFTVMTDALLADETITVEVFEADDNAGANAAEITACETVYTVPAGGVSESLITISLDVNKISKPYVTVKVSNTSAGAVLTYAELLQESPNRGASLDASDELTVV